ncbi:MAG: glycoside hydrolase family 3 N-terminal domain-containing protein [Pseudomonadota bacterium]
MTSNATPKPSDPVAELLGQMTLEEKVGQLSQLNFTGLSDKLREQLAAGEVGSLLNAVDLETINEVQRVAVEESRLGIPLLIGRDVIHGFKTVFPIPLGQAASWNPDVIEEGARVSAQEAGASGIHWTFAPMLDVCRDPRWGRIAECLGEDPWLASELARAMVKGFQGEDLRKPGAIAACAKHFAGYGACEAGRDYATTNIPENELRNVYLPPFKAAVDAGVATLMASFSDLNGIPASGNRWLMTDVLRGEWGFDGFVVSDWESVSQLAVHGLTANDRESAQAATEAGIDMEMASRTYHHHLPGLVRDGLIDEATVDLAVARVLQLKFDLGVFDYPYSYTKDYPTPANPEHLQAAREAARQSLVLLKNKAQTLPLVLDEIDKLAVIGPLADDGYEQLGTWIFDGDASLSHTPLAAIQAVVGKYAEVHSAPGLSYSRDKETGGFEAAVEAAKSADVVLMFLGEESILSGEAHSRADINLPGAQEALVAKIAELGKPIVVVVLAGRPLTLGPVLDQADAVLYAWHPGTMGGPAIADVLFGRYSPQGKLPVTFPRVVGQVPIYYSQKNTGKPATPDSFTPIDDIPRRASQTSVGNTSFHLDAGYTPQFPFGFGLSYTQFDYSRLEVSCTSAPLGTTIEVSAWLSNAGDREGTEVVQLYVRDLVGSVTRPVKELKGFQRVTLGPGEATRVVFELKSEDLAFYGRDNQLRTEPGEFHVFIGGDSATELRAAFELTA